MNLTRRSLMKGLLSVAALAPLAKVAKTEDEPGLATFKAPPTIQTDISDTHWIGDYERIRAEKEKALFENMVEHFEREMWAIPPIDPGKNVSWVNVKERY